MQAKEFLVVAHYFSPLNSTGARRPEALCRYLAARGCHVRVLTTIKSSASPQATVERGEIEVTETSTFLTRTLTGIPKVSEDLTRVRTQSRLVWFKQRYVNPWIGQLLDPRLPLVLATLFKIFAHKITGGRLFGWVEDIRKADWIISTSPPWTFHLLALAISRVFGIPLALDYRDQFSGNHMFSRRFLKLERAIDRFLANRASVVFVVSEPMADYYRELTATKVVTVMNGFDEGLISAAGPGRPEGIDSSYVVRYFGTITTDRLMKPLWEALESLPGHQNIKFEFFGDHALLQEHLTREHPNLLPIVHFRSAVSHASAISLMRTSDALLFTETSETSHASQRGVLTTKLFEYLAVKRPILAVIDISTIAGQIIKRSGLGMVISTCPLELRKSLDGVGDGHRYAPDDEYILQFSRGSQFAVMEQHLASN